ncbi:MAG: hypothetical protein IJ703_02245 [Eubacterium sp.]|nr:hypothetical protein [Eubacterium sp.]
MHRIGICDRDEGFAVGLTDYICQADGEYSAVVFSDMNSAGEYLAKNDLELILTDDISGCRVEGGRLSFHNVRCIYLSDRRTVGDVRFPGEEGPASADMIIRSGDLIYKYQRLGLILEHIRKTVTVNPPVICKKQVEAVFSPLGRCGCTTLAMALTDYMKGRGIYVGMENYSPNGIEGSEILYQIKEKIPEFAETVRRHITMSDGIEVLRAGSVYLDLRNVQKDDIICLSDCLLQTGIYSTVIYDLGSAVLDDLSLLECFDVIYMPVLDDKASQGKLAGFESILRSLELRDVMQRIIKLHVPTVGGREKMAEYVRELIENGKP